jgi:hypothetical protein
VRLLRCKASWTWCAELSFRATRPAFGGPVFPYERSIMSVSAKNDRSSARRPGAQKFVAVCALTLTIGLGGTLAGAPAWAAGSSSQLAASHAAAAVAKTPTVDESGRPSFLWPAGMAWSPDITAGHVLTIVGVGTKGDTLVLQQKFLGSADYRYKTIVTDIVIGSNGKYSTAIAPLHNAKYRVMGSNGILSSELRVDVETHTTLDVDETGRSRGLGSMENKISGQVTPAVEGQSIKLKIAPYSPLKVNTEYVTVTTDKNGKWSYKGWYNWVTWWTVVATPEKTSTNAAGASRHLFTAM